MDHFMMSLGMSFWVSRFNLAARRFAPGLGVLAASGLFLSVSTAARAQTETATVIGTVTDPQQAVVPGVTVTGRNIGTGFTRSAVSDGDGRYRLPALMPGEYEFQAALAGFTTANRRGVTLASGAEVVLNLQLGPPGLAEEVTITADSPVVQTTTAAIEQTIDRRQVDLLPLIGRSYVDLLRLAPGAAANNSSYAFTGSRGRSNQWHIDGFDNSEDISGYGRLGPSVDSIAEVQVLVNGFKAEYGEASGGVVNVITRSGTNDAHGSGFMLFRNQDLTAKNPYATEKDPFRRIHYGGTAGGPIQRDRLHFFAAYERQDRRTFAQDTRTLPAATAPFAQSTRQFLATYDVPIDLFGAGGRQRQTRPEFVYQDKLNLRFDHQTTLSQTLTFKYILDRDDEPSGQGGTLLDFNGTDFHDLQNYATISHKWIVGANKLNELYAQFAKEATALDAHFKMPVVSVSGQFQLGSTQNNNPLTNHITQLIENFTWTLSDTRTGQHVFKTGAQLKVFRSDSLFDSNFRGTWTFPDMASFLNGRPSRFTQNQGDSRLPRPNDIVGAYVQDDWRPTRSLTVNLGVRYDYEDAKTEALRAVNGQPGPGISGDKDNVAPRFGFAWAPHASTTQSFYGGSGVYYDRIILNIIGNARFTPPKVIGIQIDSPPWPDPFVGGKTQIPPTSLSIIDPNLVTPYNWNSQVGYRRELTTDLGLDVSFVYNRGYEHVGIININAGRPGSANLLGAGAARPDPAFTNKSFYTNYGYIRYKGLLVDLHKRFSRNFQANLAYTLSKTINNAFNFVTPQQVPTHPELSDGPDDTDRRHRLEAHTEARLPYGIELAAIFEFRTEPPLDVVAGARDLNGDGITGDWVNEQICVNLACPGFAYTRNGQRQLSTTEANRLRALFGLVPIESFAENPKYYNVDLTLQRKFAIGRQALRARAEIFNLFNIPQRQFTTATSSGVTQNIFSGTFGQYTTVAQPRAIQLTFGFEF